MDSPRVARAAVAVLGAGPHGLAAVLHLARADLDLARKVVVIDPSGSWLSAWDDQFARLEIACLRSPSVHHPSPDVDALSRFVDLHGLKRSDLPYDPPTAEAFAAFGRHLVADGQLDPPLACRPRAVRPDPGGVRIDAGELSVVADRLVVAANPHRRAIPAWVWSLLGQTEVEIEHAGDVDLRAQHDLEGRQVVVVGGGMTAAHLACGAARRGAHVHLIARRPLETRSFDTDPGWLGPKYLRAFSQDPDPASRLARANAARGGGTIPRWMRSHLDAAEAAGTLVVHQGSEVAEATAEGGVCRLGLADGGTVEAQRVWLATGTTPDLAALRCLAPLLPDIATVDGYPITDDDLRIGPHPVHVMGRLATATLGPAAGNLWGAQRAARRITRAITGVDLDLETVHPLPPTRRAGTSAATNKRRRAKR